jgi:hypothetical protein
VKRSLRDDMPLTAAFIDKLREAFGRDVVDQQIRRGMQGGDTFYAKENGIEVGTMPRRREETTK